MSDSLQQATIRAQIALEEIRLMWQNDEECVDTEQELFDATSNLVEIVSAEVLA